MSIRYKFILNLLALTTLCLGVYIWIAKSVFENDKEVAVFESASQTSSAQAFTLRQYLEDVISFSTHLVSTFNPLNQNFSETERSLFHKRADLIAFGVFENDQSLAFSSKDASLKPEDLSGPHQSTVIPLNQNGLLALTANLKTLEPGSVRKLIVVVDLQKQMQLLNFSKESGGSFLAIGDKPLSPQSDFPFEFAQGFLSILPLQKNLTEQTTIEKNEGIEFLISSKLVQFGDLRILTAIPKNTAFIGVNLLYKKSLQFFGLIFFIVLLVSVFMTRSLLKNLDHLTKATSEISKGSFDLQLEVKSKDEFGKLSLSFQHMSQEIKRLILETQEKARMEGELKTAQTVQENMFPAQSFRNSNLEINGLYRSASECGGDWWYHFEHSTGIYVLICDATGHGAPAALITAAAKATVNIMKKDSGLDLQKLAQMFNYALYETAKGRILMTGFVIHFKSDQTIEYINASHEPPIIFHQGDVDFLMDPIGPRFGQDPDSKYEIGKLEQLSQKTIILYTDGITGQTDAKGKEFGDKRFTRFLSKDIDIHKMPLDEINRNVFGVVDEFRENVTQADDLTIVSVRFD